jgi:DNA-binding transcriptional MerR regulator
MASRLFSRQEVNEVFEDINPRTLRSWLDMGLVEWTSEKWDRRGANRLYSIDGLYQISIVRELASLSIPLLSIRTIIKEYFASTVISEKMEHILGIAKRPDNDLTFSLAEPNKVVEMLTILSGHKRGPMRPSPENTAWVSPGMGNALPPPIIIVVNLPALKYRVDDAVKGESGA